MIVGSKKVLFMDEISTGLDSSTTYQIVKCMRNIVKMRHATILMSLLQPAPETFDLFDDVMLLAEGLSAFHLFYLPHRQAWVLYQGMSLSTLLTYNNPTAVTHLDEAGAIKC